MVEESSFFEHTYLAKRTIVITKAMPPSIGLPLHYWEGADAREIPYWGYFVRAIFDSRGLAFAQPRQINQLTIESG